MELELDKVFPGGCSSGFGLGCPLRTASAESVGGAFAPGAPGSSGWLLALVFGIEGGSRAPPPFVGLDRMRLAQIVVLQPHSETRFVSNVKLAWILG